MIHGHHDNMVDGIAVIFERAQGKKCERCWKILPDVDGICGRCAAVIAV